MQQQLHGNPTVASATPVEFEAAVAGATAIASVATAANVATCARVART